MRSPLASLLLLVPLVGCFEVNDGKGGDDSATGDGDGDPDSNLDDEDCEDPPAPREYDSACITDELVCGDSVIGTTMDGTNNLTGADYASFWACAVVGTSSYAGPERMYEFVHPGTGTVTISLASPCANLDLFAMRWEAHSCMQTGLSILECEADISSGGGSFEIWNNEPSRYVIVVEGANGEEAPFEVSARCP